MAFEDWRCPKCQSHGTLVQSDQQSGVQLVIFVCPHCLSKWTKAIPNREAREKSPRWVS
jgi:hypothetical protein